jgi:hypothetical protein
MTVTDLLKKIKSNLKNEKTAIANDMVEGRMSDFQSYSRNVGYAEGLEKACELIDETLKQLDEEDD